MGLDRFVMARTALHTREGSSAFVLPKYAFYSNVKHYRSRILVCDMPSGKRLEPLKAGQAEMSQGARDVAAMQLHKQKKRPRKSGASRREERREFYAGWPRKISEVAALQAEAGQIAVAGRDACAGHQRAIKRSHEASEEAGGRREAEGSSLRHDFDPLLEAASSWRLIIWDQCTYTRCQGQLSCLHGSMSILQCDIYRFDFLIKVPRRPP